MKEANFKVTPDLYASKGSRFANYIIDLIVIVAVLLGGFMAFAYLYYSFATDTAAMDSFLDDTSEINPLLDRLITGLVLALCYLIMETVFKGKSVGKYVTKTRVVMEDGSAPRIEDFVKRSLCRIIPFDQFSFLGAQGRGWHDSISNTYVVDEEMFNAKKESINNLDEIGKFIEE